MVAFRWKHEHCAVLLIGSTHQPPPAGANVAVTGAGLTKVLDQAGPFTLFLPNTEAFAAIDNSTVNAFIQNITLLQSGSPRERNINICISVCFVTRLPLTHFLISGQTPVVRVV